MINLKFEVPVEKMQRFCKERLKCPVMTGGLVEGAGCVMPEKLKCALHKYYKHTDFRPGQLESLLPIVHGKDLFVRLATGSGKSLCIFWFLLLSVILLWQSSSVHSMV